MYLPNASSSGSLGRISLNAASVSLEGLAVLLDEGLQRHGLAAADRLDDVVGAGEDAGLVVERHLMEVQQQERLPELAQRNCSGSPQPVRALTWPGAGDWLDALCCCNSFTVTCL